MEHHRGTSTGAWLLSHGKLSLGSEIRLTLGWPLLDRCSQLDPLVQPWPIEAAADVFEAPSLQSRRVWLSRYRPKHRQWYLPGSCKQQCFG